MASLNRINDFYSTASCNHEREIAQLALVLKLSRARFLPCFTLFISKVYFKSEAAFVPFLIRLLAVWKVALVNELNGVVNFLSGVSQT